MAARLALAAVLATIGAGALAAVGSSVSGGRDDVVDYAVATGWSPWPMIAGFAAMIAWPVLVVLADAALARVGRFRVPSGPALVELSEPPAAEPDGPSGIAARGAVVGAVLGAEVAFVVHTGGLALVAATAAGAVVVGAGGWFAHRRDVDAARRSIPAVHLAGSALGLVGLAAIGASARVVVAGRSRDVPFLPWWVVAASAAVAAAVLATRHRGSSERLAATARAAVVAVAGPVAIVLVTARIPGALGWFDLFHDGESLAPTEAVLRGATPWRDVLFIHGVLQDVLRSLPGLALVERSRWGAAAGEAMWWVPLWWLAQYPLGCWLHRGRRWVLAAQVLAVAAGAPLVFGWAALTNHRMILHPLVLLALGVSLQRRGAWPSAVLGALVVVDLVLSPESVLALFVVPLVLVAVELGERRQPDPPPSWVRLRWAALGAATASAAVAAFLAATGSWRGLLDWYRLFTGYLLTGSHPVDLTSRRVLVEIPLTLGVPLAMVVYAVLRRRFTGALRAVDWTMSAAAVGAIAYFVKFLGRPDVGHLDVVAPLCLPVAFFLLGDGVDTARRWLAGPRASRPALVRTLQVSSLAVVVGLIALAADSTRQTPDRFRPAVAAPPGNARVGYLASDVGFTGDTDRLDAALVAAGARTGGVFDVTNSPALFHFVLRYPPTTRFSNVNMAMPRAGQDQLVRELERATPSVVVWSGPDREGGLEVSDDIATMVRHHRVAQWVLDRYVPYVKVDGYGLWVRKGDRSRLPDPSTLRPDADDALPDAASPPCTWRRAPQFSTLRPDATTRGTALAFTPARGAWVRGWATVEGTSVARLYAVARGEVVASTVPLDAPGHDPALDDLAIDADAPGDPVPAPPAAPHAGAFRLFVDETDGLDASGVTIVAVDATGHAGIVGAGSRATPLVLPPSLAGAPLDAAIDGVRDEPVRLDGSPRSGLLLRAHVPRGSAIHWLRVDGHADDAATVVIGTQPAAARQTISYVAHRGDDTRQYVHVGACSQWALRGDTVYLRTTDAFTLDAVTAYG